MSAPLAREPGIDLNSDLGESYGRWIVGDDRAMLGLVTSANVACGFHAGDPATLQRTCAEAAARGVVIGAHVGYPDLAGFGRRFLDMAPDDLNAAVLYQIGALEAMARVAGSRVGYVKAHGALYNTLLRDDAQSGAVVQAVRSYDDQLAVLGQPGSRFLQLAADAGLRVVAEAFADRAYAPDGSLVARDKPGAILSDPLQAARRAVDIATTGKLVAHDGTVLDISVDTICVHGDSPDAVAMARAVRSALEKAGVALTSFVP